MKGRNRQFNKAEEMERQMKEKERIGGYVCLFVVCLFFGGGS